MVPTQTQTATTGVEGTTLPRMSVQTAPPTRSRVVTWARLFTGLSVFAAAVANGIGAWGRRGQVGPSSWADQASYTGQRRRGN